MSIATLKERGYSIVHDNYSMLIFAKDDGEGVHIVVYSKHEEDVVKEAFFKFNDLAMASVALEYMRNQSNSHLEN